MTGIVVSVCNRKGGVGKTTTAISLAHTFQSQFGKSTVLVDTDPQGTASHALLGDELFEAEPIKVKFLESVLASDALDARRVDMDRILRRMVRKPSDRPQVDLALVPISPGFWDFERDLRKQSFNFPGEPKPVKRFRKLLNLLRGSFEIVLIDTPPGAFELFEPVVQASDGVVVPCVPDRLSAWGMTIFENALKKVAGPPPRMRRALWTQFDPASNWMDTADLLLKDGFPITPFMIGGAHDPTGETRQHDGIGAYRRVPLAVSPEGSATWERTYPTEVRNCMLRVCQTILEDLTGDIR